MYYVLQYLYMHVHLILQKDMLLFQEIYINHAASVVSTTKRHQESGKYNTQILQLYLHVSGIYLPIGSHSHYS